MKKLLYYPSFEVQSEAWLKFALLYIDELRPIIPQEGDRYLSDGFNRIISETDLIRPYQPEEADSWQAAEDAIELFQRILSHPERYCEIIGNKDFLDSWRDSKSYNYTIFSEKYSLSFERFAEENQLGIRCIEGIRVNKTLGLIYMSLLTSIISDRINISPITDYSSMHNISILTRQVNQQSEEGIAIAKGLIKLQLPKNLNEISIDKIIDYRNSNGFKERLNAFHLELEKYFVDLENGTAEEGFFDSRGSIFTEFSGEIVRLGAGVIELGLGITLCVLNPSNFALLIGGLALGAQGTKLSIDSTISLRTKFKYTETKRFTRKYLADLNTLI